MKANVLSLRPTQFAIGMLEVEIKSSQIQKLKGSRLANFLEAHPVPVIRAPGEGLYLIDHHHLVRACWESGIRKVHVEVREDFSTLLEAQFWRKMSRLRWLYLHDQFGKGPHGPALLPLDVRGLADDPYRSLAWALREAQGFRKTKKPFCEFSWASFLRKHIRIHPARIGFEKALVHALALCHKAEAKRLPGYSED